jgi:hypothetical protein
METFLHILALVLIGGGFVVMIFFRWKAERLRMELNKRRNSDYWR